MGTPLGKKKEDRSFWGGNRYNIEENRWHTGKETKTRPQRPSTGEKLGNKRGGGTWGSEDGSGNKDSQEGGKPREDSRAQKRIKTLGADSGRTLPAGAKSKNSVWGQVRGQKEY